MENLCKKADEDGNTGAITYLGVFGSGGNQSNWINNEVDTDRLLALIESNAAAKVLACIGNNDYVIRAHRIQGIIMLLAWVSDMLNPEYTQGSWE